MDNSGKLIPGWNLEVRVAGMVISTVAIAILISLSLYRRTSYHRHEMDAF